MKARGLMLPFSFPDPAEAGNRKGDLKDMKCPVCGIEMLRERLGKWICPNPRCSSSERKVESK